MKEEAGRTIVWLVRVLSMIIILLMVSLLYLYKFRLRIGLTSFCRVWLLRYRAIILGRRSSRILCFRVRLALLAWRRRRPVNMGRLGIRRIALLCKLYREALLTLNRFGIFQSSRRLFIM